MYVYIYNSTIWHIVSLILAIAEACWRAYFLKTQHVTVGHNLTKLAKFMVLQFHCLVLDLVKCE